MKTRFIGQIIVLFLLALGEAARGQGSLLILSNPTNSSPRIVSVWGGAASEQIIMKSDSTVWDWGYNSFGQLGNGTTNNTDFPGEVLGQGGIGYFAPVSAIMGGEQHNTAIKPDGTVWSWGMNYYGQLGDGSTNWGSFANYSTTPVQVFGLSAVKALGGRGYHTLALKSDGTIWSWGRNRNGELGIGAAYNFNNTGQGQGTNIPVQVIGLTNPAAISGGGFFSMALMSNGTVQCWGENDHGECGVGTFVDCYTPVQVPNLSNIVAISGGWFHAMALKSDGTVWAWGDNPNGELGNGTTNHSAVPVQVLGLSNIISVRTGDGNSMALRSDGTVWKWGEDQYGELGNGTIDDGTVAHPIPIQVPSLSNVFIAVCRDYHNICVTWNGQVWVWGDNRAGGCGDLTGNSVLSPRLMPGLGLNNIIPYMESFESYSNGFSLAGTNSWASDHAAAGVVEATNYALPYNGPYPVPGSHQNVLQVNGTVTNSFCPSYYTNVWVDTMMQGTLSFGPLAPLTNASFALAVTSNGTLAVWNRTNPPASGNGWTPLLDTPVVSNQFFRLTIEANYTPDTNGIFYYSVWINGVASTNPAVRYAAADASQPWFGQLIASGNLLLDDLVVGTNKPFYALQASSSAFGGSIAPAGPVIVTPGSTNVFTMTASNWYSLSSVTVDNGNVGTPVSYTFNNVQADHAIAASYMAQLAVNNTPKWWLYQENPGWASNFDAAALSDPSGNGVPVWEDYIAGTDPFNPASALTVAITTNNGRTIVSCPTIAATPQTQSHRYYGLDSSTNLDLPSSWQGVPGWTNIQGLGQLLSYTNIPGATNIFYRGRVWLGP